MSLALPSLGATGARGARVVLIAVAMLLAFAGASSAATTVDNDDSRNVTYSGAWSTCGDAGYINSDCHFATQAGATATLSFSGTFVRWIGVTDTSYGQADVRVCDSAGLNCGAATTVDLFAKINNKQHVLYANYGLSSGAHTLKVTVGRPVDRSGVRVDIDAFASGTQLSGDFFVDNQAGSGCSNANSGTSSSSPWCDFTNLNGESFAPGSQILLARGATWNHQLGKLYGEGTPSSWIAIDAYGSGAKPKICRSRNRSDRGIWLDNPSYWELRNLEICNAGAGIVAFFTTNGHTGLRFEHIFTHDNDVIHNGSPAQWVVQPDLPGMYHGVAILITGQVPVTPSTNAISDITYDDIESFHDSNPIDISGFNPGSGGLNFLSTDLGHHAAGNILMRNVNLHDAKSQPNFDNVEHFKIVSSRIVRMCTAAQSVGTTGLFFWSVADVTLANNVIRDTPATGSADQTGVDLEAYNDGVRFRGNLIAGHAGPGLEVLALFGRPLDFSVNHEFSSNSFVNNAISPFSHQASFFIVNGTGVSLTATTRDNLFDESDPIQTGDAELATWTWANNRDVEAGQLSNGGDGFSSTQGANNWSFQSFDGSSWSNLSYDSTNDFWGTASEFVGRFDTQPSACAACWTGRAWTAPKSGTVSVRGRVLKNLLGGDGVLARITVNETKVWPPSSSTQSIGGTDQSGVDANIDELAVTRGDVIRFEVNAGGSADNASDLTSWSPSVGYRAPAVAVVDDFMVGTGDNQLNYASGTWSINGNGHYNLGTTTSAHYLVRFTGRQVVVRGGKYVDRGIGAYSICDANGANCGAETFADEYSSVDLDDQLLYTSPLLSNGQHTLKVRTTNTKDASSSGFIVGVDRVLVSGAPSVVEDTTTGTGDGQVNYASGTWGTAGAGHFNLGTTTTAHYLVKFTGTQVVVHGGKYPDRGFGAYSICDANGANCGPELLVDAFGPSLDDQILFTSPLLPRGQHTLKVRTAGARNVSSSGFIVDVDKVIVN